MTGPAPALAPARAKYDLLGAAFHADPTAQWPIMQREDPVYWDPVLRAWVLTRWDDVLRVVRDPSFSVDRGGSISRTNDDGVRAELAWCSEFVLRWMVFADPPQHTRLRAAVHRAFAASSIARLRPTIAEITGRTVAPLRARGRLEVIADVAVPVPTLVTAALLGLPASDGELLKGWTADIFALLGAGISTAPVIHAALAAMRACDAYFGDVIAARRRQGGDDLLADIVRSDEAAALDRDELIGLCVTLVAGAYETTTHLIGNGLWALLRHRDQLDRLRAEPSLLDNAVEELFRYDGPALSVVRRARADVEVGGAGISAGDNVYCMLHAANHDPARHVDPGRLDVARHDPRHLGLGHGLHFCLGAALSRLEAVLMLEALVGLDGLELDRDALEGAEPSFVPNLAIRGLQALPVRFVP